MKRAILLLSIGVAACGKPAPKAAPTVGATAGPAEIARPVSFVFDSLDARPVSASAFLGKPTVLAFITTWDLLSQAQVDFLVAMAKHDEAKTNYTLVAMQDKKERELIEQYARTLGVTFPVALLDPEARSIAGTFGEIDHVPEVVVLDREGRIAWRRTGLVKSDELRIVLSKLK